MSTATYQKRPEIQLSWRRDSHPTGSLPPFSSSSSSSFSSRSRPKTSPSYSSSSSIPRALESNNWRSNKPITPDNVSTAGQIRVGQIMFLPDKSKIPETSKAHKTVDDGQYDHPCVVVKVLKSGDMQVRIITSLGNCPLKERHPEKMWEFYLLINHPNTHDNDRYENPGRPTLNLIEGSTEKPSYVAMHTMVEIEPQYLVRFGCRRKQSDLVLDEASIKTLTEYKCKSEFRSARLEKRTSWGSERPRWGTQTQETAKPNGPSAGRVSPVKSQVSCRVSVDMKTSMGRFAILAAP